MNVRVRYAHSDLDDPAAAVDDLSSQFGEQVADCMIFFCSADYDLPALGAELDQRFSCPIAGCTSSGQIGPAGFYRSGISAIVLGGGFRVRVFPVHPLHDYQDQVAQIASSINGSSGSCAGQRFGLLLVDGLSMMEERLTASLYQSIGNIPIVGGSAGDNLNFARTHIYVGGGRFESDAAVFTVVESEGPVLPFKVQHFVPGEVDLVITEADPENRVIREINGEPAARAYADAIGMTVEELSPSVFSSRPLVLVLGGERYLRSIQKVNDDLSLACYCAIDEGLILHIGEAIDPAQCLEDAFAEIHAQIPQPQVILGCDCILRRLEYEQGGSAKVMGELMARNKVFGFSTYGEQFNGVHVNQTLTGVVIGE